MEGSQLQLNTLLKTELNQSISSSEEQSKDIVQSRAAFRKPIKNPFSQYSDESDSSQQDNNNMKNPQQSPFMVHPPKQQSVLQMAQAEMKWDKQEQLQINILTKLEGNGMKDKKIKELANRCKMLNLAFEKEKTIRRTLEAQLAMGKTNDRKKSIEKKSMEDKVSLEQTTKTEDRSAKEKCAGCVQAEKKNMEGRLKYQNLKSQLNKAHRLISRQLGDKFDIDEALSQENGWKGRQQKIEILKGRVKELQQKLQNNGVNVSHMSGFTDLSQANKTNNMSMTSVQRSSTLLAESKRKEMENLKIQVDALKSENQLLQGKVKALASRKITLENELKEVKIDFEKKKQIFSQKSQNDDKFISLLKQENQRLKKDEKVITKIVYKQHKQNQKVNTSQPDITSQRKVAKPLKNPSPEVPQPQVKEISPLPVSNTKIPQRPNNEQLRPISSQKRKQVEEEYLKGGNKYLKQLTAQQEAQIYRTWKQSKNKN